MSLTASILGSPHNQTRRGREPRREAGLRRERSGKQTMFRIKRLEIIRRYSRISLGLFLLEYCPLLLHTHRHKMLYSNTYRSKYIIYYHV